MIQAAEKVIVGMSGGVDSSVAALLLLEQGYTVEGLFMKNWDEDDGTEYCTAKQDLSDAEKVCQKLGIKLHTANFAAEYWDNVFEHFLTEYRAARTPNPDILCNREIKFKVFIDYAKALGAEKIATGHYARTYSSNNKTYLAKGLDANKDQSYFLHAVSETEFAKTLFPVGELKKEAVRALAYKHDFVTHDKKDSTGICFIGERRFKDFLQTYLPAQPGEIVDDKGHLLGEHDGLMFHTIGQRQGLGIGGIKDAGQAPWYVAKKCIRKNQLIVVQGKNHPALFSQKLTVQNLHWINDKATSENFTALAKVRYRQEDQACEVSRVDDHWVVNFANPQRAVTPGQYLVLYDNDICLGGGVIQTAFN